MIVKYVIQLVINALLQVLIVHYANIFIREFLVVIMIVFVIQLMAFKI